MSRYVLHGVIASGGMGIVYDAVQRFPDGTERPRALKFILPELAGNSAIVKRFGREAEAYLTAGAHPNIVRFFEFDCDPQDRLFLSFERLFGASLEEMARCEANHGVIRRIVYHVAEALVHMHARGLIHRDLTPRNIFMTIDGTVKVIDLGLACIYDTEQSQPGFQGTPAYASPEAVNGSPIGPSADLFSLGTICYALLAGTPPFGFGSLEEVKARMDHWDIAPLPDSTPDDLRAITMGLLHREPGDRKYQSAVDLILALDQFAGPLARDEALTELAGQALARMPKPTPIARETFNNQAIVRVVDDVHSPGELLPVGTETTEATVKRVLPAKRQPFTRLQAGLLALVAVLLLWVAIRLMGQPSIHPSIETAAGRMITDRSLPPLDQEAAHGDPAAEDHMPINSSTSITTRAKPNQGNTTATRSRPLGTAPAYSTSSP